MMNDLIPMVVVGTIAYTTYKLFELFARRKERMAMIEKLSLGFDPQSVKNQLDWTNTSVFNQITNSSWPIRIGMLLIGIGLGLTLVSIIDLVSVAPATEGRLYHDFRRTIDGLYPSCAAVFGGIGLVIAYVIEKKDSKTKE